MAQGVKVFEVFLQFFVGIHCRTGVDAARLKNDLIGLALMEGAAPGFLDQRGETGQRLADFLVAGESLHGGDGRRGDDTDDGQGDDDFHQGKTSLAGDGRGPAVQFWDHERTGSGYSLRATFQFPMSSALSTPSLPSENTS